MAKKPLCFLTVYKSFRNMSKTFPGFSSISQEPLNVRGNQYPQLDLISVGVQSKQREVWPNVWLN